MSIKLMNLIWDTHEIDLSPAEIAVFVRMASYARDDGSSIYPSLNRISKDTRFSRATVIRSIRTIIKKGFMTKVSEHSNKHKLANVYEINVDFIKKMGGDFGKNKMLLSENSHEPFPSQPCHAVNEPCHTVPLTMSYSTTNHVTMTTYSLRFVSIGYKDIYAFRQKDPVDNFFGKDKIQDEKTYLQNLPSKNLDVKEKSGITIKTEKRSRELRGCRLDPDVVLTDEWFDVLVKSGIHGSHADKIFKLFVGYWVSKPGKDALKVNWKMTWRTWCIRALGFDKMLKYSVQAQSAGGTSEELVMMGIDRHAQHKRYEQTGDPLDKPKILTFDDALERCYGGGS